MEKDLKPLSSEAELNLGGGELEGMQSGEIISEQ